MLNARTRAKIHADLARLTRTTTSSPTVFATGVAWDQTPVLSPDTPDLGVCENV